MILTLLGCGIYLVVSKSVILTPAIEEVFEEN